MRSRAGATFADVVPTDRYATGLGHLAILREVRSHYFPTGQHIQVDALVRPELMIEIAAEAVLPDAGP